MLKHSSIYGVFNILSRVIGFLMIPVYTRFLTPSDYGTIELLDLTGYVVSMFIGLSFSNSITRFYYELTEEKERNLMVSTSLLFVGISGLLVCTALFAASTTFTKALFGASGDPGYFRIMFVTLVFQVLIEECVVLMQVRQQAFTYAVFATARLIIGLTLNILFVVHFRMGVYGILYSGLATSVLTGVFIYIKTLAGTGLGFSKLEINRLLKFGLPMFLAGFGPFILTFSDRYFLNHYAPLADVGIYALAYKISMLISVLVTNPFQLTWAARRFQFAKRDDAKLIMSRVFSYFCAIIFFVAMGLAITAPDILRIIVGREFWGAARYIPLLTASYVLFAFYYHFNYGIFLVKKPIYATWIWAAGGAVNLVCNYFLIKAFHGMGAAIATIISYAFISGLTLVVSQKFYFIPFEIGRLLKLVVAMVPVCVAAHFLPAMNPYVAIVAKTCLLGLFPACLYLMRFLHPDERKGIAGLLSASGGLRGLISKVRGSKA
jgi:O-antigen/teichoic acid export membrane protein